MPIRFNGSIHFMFGFLDDLLLAGVLVVRLQPNLSEEAKVKISNLECQTDVHSVTLLGWLIS